ncbi:MAG TPA: cytosine deaminase, partial [Jatrophihabitantaceae bacterium]
MATLIRDARPWGGPPSDVTVADGRITALAPHDSARPDEGEVVDGRGRLLLPAFSDVHVHLDSTRLGLPFRPHTGGPGVWTMMLNDRRHWREAEWPIAQRATHTLELMI